MVKDVLSAPGSVHILWRLAVLPSKLGVPRRESFMICPCPPLPHSILKLVCMCVGRGEESSTAVPPKSDPVPLLTPGLPCRSFTRPVKWLEGTTTSLGAWLSSGPPTTRAASVLSRVSSMSGMPCRTWSPHGPTPQLCLSTSKCTASSPTSTPTPCLTLCLHNVTLCHLPLIEGHFSLNQHFKQGFLTCCPWGKGLCPAAPL